MNGQASFEKGRDTIRHELHSQSPAHGTRGTSVSALASAILAPQNFVAISSPECTNCEYSEASIDDRLDFVLVLPQLINRCFRNLIIARSIKTIKAPKCLSG